MRVLVACEFSGIVRDAFAARGHDAWSCDLLPTEALRPVRFAADFPACDCCGEEPWCEEHGASKATCLWLKGLPPLIPTEVLPGGKVARRANQTASGQNRLGPSPDRWKLRSLTYPGIAKAMADQWGTP